MVSIRDVAKAAGVSTATVARVLNGGTPVSPDRTERVLRAVRELDYVSNGVAASLSRGRTGLLGLLVSDIANPFTAQVARGLEDEAVRRGYQVLIASSDFDSEREAQVLASFARRTVDAVALLSSSGVGEGVARLVRNGIPTVFVDRRPPDLGEIPLVRTDSLGAAREAVRYLIDLGHTDLGMISGPSGMPTATQRLAGFREACQAAGLVVRPECVREGFLGTAGGYTAMCEVLDLDVRPTAVFSFNNVLAIGALQAVRERGVRIPADLSLVTFDDTDLFPFVDPPITAIEQPAYEIGAQAGTLLFTHLDGGRTAGADVVLPTRFHIRSSCARPGR
ncbi:LacI family DNA-binding transcriptional regulator [Amycolatopsis jiangsuensis]|uniref:LacI family transcriptional regulator n=1 Tax=Amycolatopsis jiangsuensis TaxID=1181879 RepID=A0A840IME6_9PSEU|nr:LacI family DNA-binding transcriptional regulator [Amycolatopsis jiangsuensis]MBB4683506.1 LacI family transcriptional regulator [Amycolatopsis jiangsuensis]